MVNILASQPAGRHRSARHLSLTDLANCWLRGAQRPAGAAILIVGTFIATSSWTVVAFALAGLR